MERSIRAHSRGARQANGSRLISPLISPRCREQRYGQNVASHWASLTAEPHQYRLGGSASQTI
ncbi:hypothetical protein EYF80_028835 [Liparis tanakae]|uniref:Uncharacterized protein n=1 Tax=Liparis tanakae TaxID=230148 RepID=A0A4Z2H6S9_9TELE|nr:hypothetical protein EYF80_028835 [Liparis tanakae]